MKKIKQGIKASLAFFVASVVTKGISYLTTPFFTRLLSSEEYGQVTVFMTWLQIFGIVAMFCLSYGVFNNGMIEYPEKRDKYSFSMLILSNIITLCFSGVLLCLYPLVKAFIGLDLPFIILMIVIFLTQPAYNFWVARQRYELKYKMTVLWSILSAILSTLVAIICILTWKDGEKLYPRIFGAEVTLIVFYIGFYVYLAVKNKGKIDIHYWKEALLFNLPLIPHYLSIYLLSASDKIMINKLVGDSETAYYGVAHSIASIAIILWSAINASLIPYTYEKCKSNDFKSINKVTLPLVFLFAVGCLCVVLLAPEAVKIMATEEYYEAIYVIPPIVGGVFFQVQYYVYANIVYYYKRPVYVMIGSFVAVVINIVLNYFLIQKWGYMAAGYTTIISYVIQALIDFIAMRKVAKTNVYNMKIILILSICVLAAVLGINFIYDLWIARYSILLVLFALIIIFRKKIISIIKFKDNSYSELAEEQKKDI